MSEIPFAPSPDPFEAEIGAILDSTDRGSTHDRQIDEQRELEEMLRQQAVHDQLAIMGFDPETFTAQASTRYPDAELRPAIARSVHGILSTISGFVPATEADHSPDVIELNNRLKRALIVRVSKLFSHDDETVRLIATLADAVNPALEPLKGLDAADIELIDMTEQVTETDEIRDTMHTLRERIIALAEAQFGMRDDIDWKLYGTCHDLAAGLFDSGDETPDPRSVMQILVAEIQEHYPDADPKTLEDLVIQALVLRPD